MSKAVPLLINPFSPFTQSASFQIDQMDKAKKEAKRANDEANQRANDQLAALNKQNQLVADQRNMAQRIAVNRSKMANSGTRYPTIMTSPLGLSGNSSSQPKTLLGQ